MSTASYDAFDRDYNKQLTKRMPWSAQLTPFQHDQYCRSSPTLPCAECSLATPTFSKINARAMSKMSTDGGVVREDCRLLEDVGQEEAKDVELVGYQESLQRVLEVVESGGLLELDLLAVVMVVGMGHSGQHYWTNQDTRQLASSELTPHCTCKVLGW